VVGPRSGLSTSDLWLADRVMKAMMETDKIDIVALNKAGISG
jgi:hypothetical protein